MKQAIILEENDLRRIFDEVKNELTNEVFTREEAAGFVKFSPSKFDRLVDNGVFRAHHPGGKGSHPRLEDLKKM